MEAGSRGAGPLEQYRSRSDVVISDRFVIQSLPAGRQA